MSRLLACLSALAGEPYMFRDEQNLRDMVNRWLSTSQSTSPDEESMT